MQQKSKITALILSVLLGGLGIDRFYLGYTGMGILKLFTAGCFGVLYILDIINIATGKLQPANGAGYEDDFNAPAVPKISAADDLAKIAELHKAGALTDEEYSKMKADLLAKM